MQFHDGQHSSDSELNEESRLPLEEQSDPLTANSELDRFDLEAAQLPDRSVALDHGATTALLEPDSELDELDIDLQNEAVAEQAQDLRSQHNETSPETEPESEQRHTSTIRSVVRGVAIGVGIVATLGIGWLGYLAVRASERNRKSRETLETYRGRLSKADENCVV